MLNKWWQKEKKSAESYGRDIYLDAIVLIEDAAELIQRYRNTLKFMATFELEKDAIAWLKKVIDGT